MKNFGDLISANYTMLKMGKHIELNVKTNIVKIEIQFPTLQKAYAFAHKVWKIIEGR